MAQPGEPVETLFVDLAVKTEDMKRDVEKAVDEAGKKVEAGFKEPIERTEKRFIGLGQIVKTTFQAIISVLLQTRDPFVALTAGIMTFNGGIQAAAASGNDLAEKLSKSTAIVAGLTTSIIALVAILRPAVDFLKEMGQAGLEVAARVDSLRIGLGVVSKEAGQNIEFVNQKVEDLQQTGITTQEAIEGIMQFLTLRLPIDNIEELARAGQDMAVAYGRNSTETFNRFIYAITTGQTEVLAMVGIQETATQMQERYARTLDRGAESLSTQEKRQAILNGILQQAQAYTGLYEESLKSVGKQLGSLPRHVQEAQLAFGSTLLPVLEGQVTVTTELMKAFKALFVVLDSEGVPVIRNGKVVFTDLGQAIFDVATKFKDLTLFSLEGIEKLQALGNAVTPIIMVFGLFLDLIIELKEESAKLWTKIITGSSDTRKELGFLQTAFKTTETIAINALAGIAAGIVGLTLVVRNFGDIVEAALAGKFSVAMAAIRDEMARTYASYQTIIGSIGRVTRGREPRIPVGGQLPFPDTGEAAAESASKMNAAAIAIANAIDAGRQRIAEAAARFAAGTGSAGLNMARAMAKLAENLEEAIQDVIDATGEAMGDLAADLAAALADVSEDAREAEADENEEFQEQQLRAEEDYLRELQRLDEDYALNIADAAQSRDAKRVLQLMRQKEIDKTRMAEDFNLRNQREEEDHQERLDDIKEQEEDRRRELEEQYARQMADLQETMDERIEELEEQYQKQLEDLEEAAAEQASAEQDSWEERQEQMEDALVEQIRTMVQGWADQKILTAKEAGEVLKILDDFYGTDGRIEALIDDFIARLKRNARLTILIEAGPWPINVPTTEPGAEHQQVGGLHIATRAKTVTFGEAGPEAALFMPMASHSFTGLSSLGNLLGSAVPRGELIEMYVKVEADQAFSIHFEDRLLGRLADVVEAVLPKTRIVRR